MRFACSVTCAIDRIIRGRKRLRRLDSNKIIRAAYGSQIEYQDLALDAISHWTRWNAEIESGKALPPGFTTSDILYVNNGDLTMNSNECLTQFEIDSIQNMTKSGFARTQLVLTNAIDVSRAKADGFGFAVNPFYRKNNFGILDTMGGFVYADKACQFALHMAEILGVQ
jgi:sarcosine oxidase/L-pipecolate oxidase